MSETTAPSPAAGVGDGPGGDGTNSRRLRALLLLVVAVAVIAVLVALAVHRGASRPSTGRAPLAAHVPLNPTVVRDRQIKALLAAQSQAVVTHNRKLFVSTLDPRRTPARASMLRDFDNASAIKFSLWSYDVGLAHGRSTSGNAAAGEHRDSTFVPSSFSLSFRIAGFDTADVSMAERASFVDRDGTWLVASISNPPAHGTTPAPAQIWDFAPVHVVHAHRVLVLGPASMLPVMREVASLARRAIPKVTALWGKPWAERAVLQVPSTQAQLARLTGFVGPLAPIAALTSAEIHLSGRADPSGDRVSINPANWSRISPIGRRIVITHELTHVASRADTSADTPRWLSEGLAEWVSFHNSGVPVTTAAIALADRVKSGPLAKTLPSRLPTNADFIGAAHKIDIAYDEAWLACIAIADHWGRTDLMAFYRAVGTSQAKPSQAVAVGLRQVLHTTPQHFISVWRATVANQLG